MRWFYLEYISFHSTESNVLCIHKPFSELIMSGLVCFMQGKNLFPVVKAAQTENCMHPLKEPEHVKSGLRTACAVFKVKLSVTW